MHDVQRVFNAFAFPSGSQASPKFFRSGLANLLGRSAVAAILCLSLVSATTAARQADSTTAVATRTQQAAQVDTGLVWLEPLVVTGSRTKQRLFDAPASMSVLTDNVIATAPAQDFGNLLRRVPGLNVTQLSARDVQLVGRGSAGTLASSQLVVVDGRTINLDFFGFVMWDLVPVDAREVKQVEVMRSPGSAVWGASAMSGVVNVITRTPKEMLGTSITAGGGEFGTAYSRFTHASINGKLGYKVSAGLSRQDPFDRPSGLIPGTSTPYPPVANKGTTQPKLDVRFDYDHDEVTTWTASAGYAGTEGILHSGIGPFDIDQGTFLAYARVAYLRRDLSINFFSNVLDGDATNLLTVDPTGQPVAFRFETQTYRLDLANSTALGDRHVLTYGANARRSNYDITLAPDGKNRDEAGVYLQDALKLSNVLRWVAGVRWDHLEPIGSVFSPRTSLMFTPHRDHTLRLSFNRAFRAPPVLNNHIELDNVNVVALPPSGTPFTFTSLTRGNPDLQEEHVTAIEAGYLATLMDRFNVGLSIYRNHKKDGLDFYPQSFYSPGNPPPGWPLPPSAVPANTFPERFSFQNHGETIDRGLEVSLEYFPHHEWSTFANYSFQDDPQVRGIRRAEISTPPKHRFNLGAAYDAGRYFANADLNYVDDAFWVDVLDSRFWGPTNAFTQVNLAAGLRAFGDRATLTVMATNVLDARVQQHVFGDLLRRRVIGEIRLNFPS